MIVVISPAKRLDFEAPANAKVKAVTQPDFLAEAQSLVDELREYTPRRLRNLMGISADLAELNAERYQSFKTPFTQDNAKPALLAFKGDVYLGLEAETLKSADFNFAQKHLRILSGLYGVLRPLDLIQPYRLEMGTKLKNPRGKDLYAYWSEQVTDTLNNVFAGQPKSEDKVLINLASNEYFGAVEPSALDGEVVNVTFKDMNKGRYKVLSFFAKKARGYMTNFIITNRIKTAKELREFDVDGYAYSSDQSSPNDLVFLRDLKT